MIQRQKYLHRGLGLLRNLVHAKDHYVTTNGVPCLVASNFEGWKIQEHFQNSLIFPIQLQFLLSRSVYQHRSNREWSNFENKQTRSAGGPLAWLKILSWMTDLERLPYVKVVKVTLVTFEKWGTWYVKLNLRFLCKRVKNIVLVCTFINKTVPFGQNPNLQQQRTVL